MTNTMTDDRKALLINLLSAVVADGDYEIRCNDVDHQNWFDLRDKLVAELSAQPSPDTAQGGECGEVALLQPWEEWIEQHAETEPLLLDDWYVPVTKLKEYFAKMHPPADAVSSVQDEGMVAIDDQTRSALMEAIDHFRESAEEWDASNSPEAERGAAQDRWNADLLSRLAST